MWQLWTRSQLGCGRCDPSLNKCRVATSGHDFSGTAPQPTPTPTPPTPTPPPPSPPAPLALVNAETLNLVRPASGTSVQLYVHRLLSAHLSWELTLMISPSASPADSKTYANLKRCVCICARSGLGLLWGVPVLHLKPVSRRLPEKINNQINMNKSTINSSHHFSFFHFHFRFYFLFPLRFSYFIKRERVFLPNLTVSRANWAWICFQPVRGQHTTPKTCNKLLTLKLMTIFIFYLFIYYVIRGIGI